MEKRWISQRLVMLVMLLIAPLLVFAAHYATSGRAEAAQLLTMGASSTDAWAKYQTVTYSFKAEAAGTLSYVVMTIPQGATLESGLRTSSGTVAYYKPGQIIWRPNTPYAIAVGANFSLPITGISFGAAGTTSMWAVAADPSGNRLAYAAGNFTIEYHAEYATCPTINNGYVAAENSKPGTNQWRITPSTYDVTKFVGYANKDSYKCGDIAYFKIDSKVSKLSTVSVYRMGYYGGNGAREIYSTSGNFLTTAQPAIQKISTSSVKNSYDASNWLINFGLRIDGRFMPGVYLAKFSDGAGRYTYAPFTVRDDTGLKHDYLLQQATTTWHAYNTFGGSSFYTAIPNNASRLSFNRPYSNPEGYGAGEFLKLESGLVYHLERQGYDVAYWTDTDLQQRPTEIATRTRSIILPAHDEYYSTSMRSALLTAAQQNGVDIISFGANQIHRVITYTADSRAFDVNNAYSMTSGSDYYKTTFRAVSPSMSEQMVTGAQYGCAGHGSMVATSAWMFAGVPSGTALAGFINGEADYQNGIERAYGLGFTVPKPTGSVKITPDYAMDNCRIAQEAGVMNVVTYEMPSGAKVFSGSTHAYGCFINKTCPSGWKEGAGYPDGSGNTVFNALSISDQDSAYAARIVDNVLQWASDL